MRILSSLLFFLLLSLGLVHLNGQPASLTVALGGGTNVNGAARNVIVPQTGAAVSVKHFLGVPFAAPPVGAFRFAPPQPPQYGATVDALAYANGMLLEYICQHDHTIITNY